MHGSKIEKTQDSGVFSNKEIGCIHSVSSGSRGSMSDRTNTKHQNQRKQRNKHHYIITMVEMPTDKAPKAYAAV
jgi:hypothetical protein